jgi:NAD(P)-dependent dehydrogenase (short-subunit alcohol dehydrogenase family)
MSAGVGARCSVVTGGAAGIGRATVLALLERHDRLHVLDRDAAALGRLSDEVRALRPAAQLVTHAVDLADRSAADEVGRRILCACDGRIDTLVNNAGVSRLRQFDGFPDADLDPLLAVNFVAGFRLTRQLLPGLLATRGTIISVASELALIGQAGYSAYAATKGAILAWTRSLAVELGGSGVRVNAVCPGPIETALLAADLAASGNAIIARAAECATVPLQRVGEASEIASVIRFLAGAESAYVTGAVWTADGGKTAA